MQQKVCFNGLIGAIEETSVEELQHVLDVNFFGAVHVTQAVLPYLREQRSGHIVNITSIAGFTAPPGYGFYAAAKYALEGMSLSLRQELAPLGIQVTLVEPGLSAPAFWTKTPSGTHLGSLLTTTVLPERLAEKCHN
jgi:short-subunit dehydrogenase